MIGSIKIRDIISISLIIVFFYLFLNNILPQLLTNNNLRHNLERFVEESNNLSPIPINMRVEYFNLYELYMERAYYVRERTILFKYKFRNFTLNDNNQLFAYFIETPLIESLYDLLIDLLFEAFDEPSAMPIRNQDVVFEHIFFDRKEVELFRIRLLFNTPIVSIN